MLKLEVNLLLGQLIGLINGLYNDPDIIKIEPIIRKSISDIKNNQDLSSSRDAILAEKKKYLAKCVSCEESCGKSDDYFLNSITNKEVRETKINDFLTLVSNYNEDLDYQTILDEIAMLRWW